MQPHVIHLQYTLFYVLVREAMVKNLEFKIEKFRHETIIDLQHLQWLISYIWFLDQVNFAREFASGYLIGEVLNKYQLQNDFDQFSQSK